MLTSQRVGHTGAQSLELLIKIARVSAMQDVVAEFARAVIVAAAPAELPLFPAISRAYLADPDRAAQRARSGDDILGFGAAEAASLLTPAALAAATAVADLLTFDILPTILKSGAEHVAAQIAKLFRREPDALRLTDAQLAEVRKVALATAKNFHLPELRATTLADALVGRLAVGGSG